MYYRGGAIGLAYTAGKLHTTQHNVVNHRFEAVLVVAIINELLHSLLRHFI